MQRKNVNPTDRSWSIQGQDLFPSSDGRDSFSPHLSASINAPTSDSLTFLIFSVSYFNFLFFFSPEPQFSSFFHFFHGPPTKVNDLPTRKPHPRKKSVEVTRAFSSSERGNASCNFPYFSWAELCSVKNPFGGSSGAHNGTRVERYGKTAPIPHQCFFA